MGALFRGFHTSTSKLQDYMRCAYKILILCMYVHVSSLYVSCGCILYRKPTKLYMLILLSALPCMKESVCLLCPVCCSAVSFHPAHSMISCLKTPFLLQVIARNKIVWAACILGTICTTAFAFDALLMKLVLVIARNTILWATCVLRTIRTADQARSHDTCSLNDALKLVLVCK